jgi:arylsulfatase A-like enzyme
MGWRDIGYHGSEIQTPNLDRLAREGRVFDQHYVLPTCTPTRVGLMSGQYPSRFGVLSPAYGDIFGDETLTLPEILKRKGYATHISGKWHMGSPPEFTPMKYGFTSSYGYFAGQIDPYTHLYKTGEKSWHRNDTFLDETGHATDLITADAVRVIHTRHTGPFFLYVAYSVPHSPLKEPERWLALYPGIQEASRRWFAASVTHMDDGIGQIVEALDETGLRKNTLLVFISDNGGQKSWHSTTQYQGRYADLPHTVLGNNLPLRGWKGECYEGGIRVPGFVNWPGTLAPGKITAPVHIVDWMPTLCHLTGAEPERSLPWDGRNIWPVIQGQTQQVSDRMLYWKTPNASALRRGDWKLILSHKSGKLELFNLAEDPYEKRDLANEESERTLEFSELLKHVASRDRERR